MPGRPPSRNTVHRILGGPYYVGHPVYDSERYDGRHQAIVTNDPLERVQNILELRTIHATWLQLRTRTVPNPTQGATCGRSAGQRIRAPSSRGPWFPSPTPARH